MNKKKKEKNTFSKNIVKRKVVEKEYFFPEYQITVKASNRKEADRKLNKLIKQ